jgi:transposase
VLTSLDEKRRLLARLVDKVATGRSAQARPPTDAELLATAVIAVRITHASMKSREGGPRDLPGDEGFAVWTGVVPLQLRAQAAEPEARVQPEWLAPMLPDRLR